MLKKQHEVYYYQAILDPYFNRIYPYMNIFSDDQTFLFGETMYRNGGRFGPYHQSQMEFVLLASGEAIVNIDGRREHINADQCAVVYNAHMLEYVFPAGKDTLVKWCETGEPLISSTAIEKIRSLPLTLEPSERIHTILAMGISMERSTGPNYELLRNLLGQALLQEFFYQAHLIEEESPYPESVLRAKRFIEHNFSESCSLRDIALYAGISPQHLIKLFRKYFENSPAAYLWSLRAEKGVHLLSQSGLKIYEIAEQCGYKNANHFSIQIKNYYGYCPSELRKREWYRKPSTIRL